MKRAYISALVLLALAITPATAQKKQKAAARPAARTAVKTAVQPKAEKVNAQKLEQMIEATQKIVFIDSIVVDKNDFLSRYRLSPEAGGIYHFNDFFRVKKQPNAYVHVNELGNKSYYSVEDSVGHIRLFTSDYEGGKWSQPAPLPGLDDNQSLQLPNYPFMMADGVTLYFAAKGPESLGGYDIFVTRFDAQSGKFLKPENIGMPFNSTANDYMLAIDEMSNIGWFATDRNQTGGKVCIYIFIPSATRQTHAEDNLPADKLKRLAYLHSIADTWGDGKARTEALERLRKLSAADNETVKKPAFTFVINDNLTYTKEDDFKTEEGKAKFKKLQTMKANLTSLDKALDKARTFYVSASKQDRRALTSEILQSEQQQESLLRQIAQTEKEIRNAENNRLNK